VLPLKHKIDVLTAHKHETKKNAPHIFKYADDLCVIVISFIMDAFVCAFVT